MTRDTLYDETRRVAANLNSDQYPEAGIALELALVGVDPFDVNILRVAIDLLECDKPGPLPACLLEYIADLYRLGIAEENADAMNDLGAMYYNGSRGFEQNYEKAVYYYKMAMKNGSRQARENLGYCYYYGRVGEADGVAEPDRVSAADGVEPDRAGEEDRAFEQDRSGIINVQSRNSPRSDRIRITGR